MQIAFKATRPGFSLVPAHFSSGLGSSPGPLACFLFGEHGEPISTPGPLYLLFLVPGTISSQYSSSGFSFISWIRTQEKSRGLIWLSSKNSSQMHICYSLAHLFALFSVQRFSQAESSFILLLSISPVPQRLRGTDWALDTQPKNG